MTRSPAPPIRVTAAALVTLLGACSTSETPRAEAATPPPAPATATVVDSQIEDVTPFPGTAVAIREATLSTKLMATVAEVTAVEGARVAAGAIVAKLDARDIAAKQVQAAAGLATAQSAHAEARLHADRIRSLFDDSAATPAQRDAAEASLARATAAVDQARGAEAELRALVDYAVIRAPFAGTVARRFVDPGAFAAPGAPLLTIVDDAALRVRVEIPLDHARALRHADRVTVRLGAETVGATVEGIAPAGGNLYVVNAIVPNTDRRHLPGTPAALEVPRGQRRALLVPTAALRQDGDLIGVDVETAAGPVRRWIRRGATLGVHTEILSGLSAGDRVVITTTGSR